MSKGDHEPMRAMFRAHGIRSARLHHRKRRAGEWTLWATDSRRTIAVHGATIEECLNALRARLAAVSSDLKGEREEHDGA